MSESILVTPSIDLTYINPEAIISARLYIMHYYNFTMRDGGWVEINPKQFNIEPEPLEPDDGYPAGVLSWRTSVIPGYLEINLAWELATFDLSD